MNKEMELIFKGTSPSWEKTDLSQINTPNSYKMGDTQVQLIPSPSMVPNEVLSYKTIHGSLHFEFKYLDGSPVLTTIENRFGVFKLDKYDKNIVEITFFNKQSAEKWVSRPVDKQSHSGVICTVVKEKLSKFSTIDTKSLIVK